MTDLAILTQDHRKIVDFSRRVDCAPFEDWFLRRLDEGVAHGINPINGRPYDVKLTIDDVKLLVLWTKAPGQIVNMVNTLRKRGFAVAVFATINDYDKWLEPWVPPLLDSLAGLQEINNLIGRDAVWWRFDPIVPTDVQNLDWFKGHLAELRHEVKGLTSRCITSIVNTEQAPKYRQCATNIDSAARQVGQTFQKLTRDEKLRWVGELSNVVGDIMDLPLEVCCHPFLDNDEVDPNQKTSQCAHLLTPSQMEIVQSYPNLRSAPCIDAVALDKLGVLGDRRDGTHSLGSKRKGDIRYDTGMCQCRKSIDIGGSVPCPHGCVYCQWPHADEEGPSTIQVDPSNPALETA